MNVFMCFDYLKNDSIFDGLFNREVFMSEAVCIVWEEEREREKT